MPSFEAELLCDLARGFSLLLERDLREPDLERDLVRAERDRDRLRLLDPPPPPPPFEFPRERDRDRERDRERERDGALQDADPFGGTSFFVPAIDSSFACSRDIA